MHSSYSVLHKLIHKATEFALYIYLSNIQKICYGFEATDFVLSFNKKHKLKNNMACVTGNFMDLEAPDSPIITDSRIVMRNFVVYATLLNLAQINNGTKYHWKKCGSTCCVR